MGYFFPRVGFEHLFMSTHIVEQLSFSMLPSILTFDFDLILGSFLTFFLALMGFFSGWGSLMGYFLVGIGFDNCFWGALM